MELVRREAGLQSNKLHPDLRERVEAAVEQLGGRVTVGDVAARAGVKLADADEALKALAYDTQASLKVSSEGAVVYGFAPDFQSRLRNRSVLIAAAPLLRRTVGVLSYLVRVAFGTALIASVALVWLAIAVLLSSRNDDRDNRRRGGGGGVTFFMDPVDLFLYWDPYYERKRAARSAELRTGGMNFMEAVFSFVFGDGDPNESYEERRWQELGAMIRKKGGVLTAEEMAPFLEPPAPAPVPPAYSKEPYIPYPDESFVLPALIKFGGEAEVDEQGHILYCFPALQRTGVQQQQQKRWRLRNRTESTSWNVPLERTWELTAATPGQIAGVVTLGLFNLLGVGLLSGLLADPRGPALLAMQGLGFVVALMGPLKLYAGTFFAIPAVRWVLNQIRNQEIEARNETREAAIDVLNEAESAASSAPAAAVSDKVAAARRKALAEGRSGPQLVRDEEIIFDSGGEAGRQLDAMERDDWDQRLAQREQGLERERWGQGRCQSSSCRPWGGGTWWATYQAPYGQL
ncbi:hypothetical protein VOLCADRAFT_98565 [Volvox carteri f. nagariensis]|uniref:Iron-sulfur cluster biosynthesis family protein n=1 Tax=Volvox carteri f. nagariensis TaxID=3068 RepID=D8UFP3_VOLCA|nr:uncharacterized protein VOLCADRAFT_98565 [Volvox carteri f. nagariensis]EFJ41494.1 hypothetical protein VOLCADRAFT_98565 [Volvox carteri f. nagariensis]|eukprot:XP_002957439.1 hypothetical protein VOLCADRAFT_98565 [Volvox carteri f. nagariensis]